jgi:hypothetical protein
MSSAPRRCVGGCREIRRRPRLLAVAGPGARGGPRPAEPVRRLDRPPSLAARLRLPLVVRPGGRARPDLLRNHLGPPLALGRPAVRRGDQSSVLQGVPDLRRASIPYRAVGHPVLVASGFNSRWGPPPALEVPPRVRDLAVLLPREQRLGRAASLHARRYTAVPARLGRQARVAGRGAAPRLWAAGHAGGRERGGAGGTHVPAAPVPTPDPSGRSGGRARHAPGAAARVLPAAGPGWVGSGDRLGASRAHRTDREPWAAYRVGRRPLLQGPDQPTETAGRARVGAAAPRGAAGLGRGARRRREPAPPSHPNPTRERKPDDRGAGGARRPDPQPGGPTDHRRGPGGDRATRSPAGAALQRVLAAAAGAWQVPSLPWHLQHEPAPW